MARVLEVKACDGYRIWIRFADGCVGEVDLSDLTGNGVFQAWCRQGFFRRVHVAPHGTAACVTFSAAVDNTWS